MEEEIMEEEIMEEEIMEEEIMEEEGPSGRPRWVFVFNPFYKGPDPMKQIIWETNNADGTKGFVRNPFAPGADTSKQQNLKKLIESDGVVGPSVMEFKF